MFQTTNQTCIEKPPYKPDMEFNMEDWLVVYLPRKIRVGWDDDIPNWMGKNYINGPNHQLE